MPALVDHLAVGHHEAILHRVLVEFSAGIGMSHGNLDGFNVQFLGEGNRIVDGLVGFAGQAHDEVTVDDKAKLMAVLGELAGTLERCTFLDALENLLIARFITDNQKPTTCFFHGLQGFEVSCDARSARPRQVQGLQLGA